MNVREAIEAALARCIEYSMAVPSTSGTYIPRVNYRLGSLYVRMADLNREYTGRDAVLALTAGACDTADLDPLPLRITGAVIEDEGTADYSPGDKVALVGVDDPSELAPRATLRDGIIAGWAGELTLVTSIRVFYARRPTAVASLADNLDIRDPFTELIVIDLAKHMLQKTISLEPKDKEAIFEIFSGEEKEMLGSLDQHVEQYNFAEVSRFGSANSDRR